jgi:phosphorylcholine metabolism protein LicD
MKIEIVNSVEYLKFITDKLDSCNVPYWLECGTLLGAFREGNILNHDYDVDLGVLDDYTEVVEGLILQLEKEGHITQLPKCRRGVIYQLLFPTYMPSYRLDIYFFKRVGDRIQSKFFSTETTPKLQMNTSHIDDLQTIKLGGYSFKCPSEVEKFLKVRYGKNYMIPQTTGVCEELHIAWSETTDNIGNEYL